MHGQCAGTKQEALARIALRLLRCRFGFQFFLRCRDGSVVLGRKAGSGHTCDHVHKMRDQRCPWRIFQRDHADRTATPQNGTAKQRLAAKTAHIHAVEGHRALIFRRIIHHQRIAMRYGIEKAFHVGGGHLEPTGMHILLPVIRIDAHQGMPVMQDPPYRGTTGMSLLGQAFGQDKGVVFGVEQVGIACDRLQGMAFITGHRT